MNTFTRLAAMSFIVGFYVGCSPVKFSLDGSKCNDDTATCIVEQNKFKITDTITAGRGKVDILIVNDNSASMSFEQKRLAPRFQNFISNLDAKGTDYRIAMTTTDIKGNGVLKGGNLIPFGSNPYLTRNVTNRLALFESTIQRPETLQCEDFIANWFRNNAMSTINGAAYQNGYSANCPNGDERGVYAANLVVQNNPSNFIRTDAHLAVIFLSDEDERSGLYTTSEYPLESLDQPATLLMNVKNILGTEKYNSATFHAIVVKDSICLAQQNSQTLGTTPSPATTGLVQGSIGSVYLAFTPTWGVAADICSSNYTGQLGEIQARIESKTTSTLLKCENPEDLTVSFSSSTVNYNVQGKTLIFSQALPAGSSVTLTYTCSSI